MPFSIRAYRRFSVQCSVMFNVGLFLKMQLVSCSGFWSMKPIEGASDHSEASNT